MIMNSDHLPEVIQFSARGTAQIDPLVEGPARQRPADIARKESHILLPGQSPGQAHPSQGPPDDLGTGRLMRERKVAHHIPSIEGGPPVGQAIATGRPAPR